MPSILSGHEYYLDWKDQKGELEALSKTALEALACGCKVIHDSDLDKEINASEMFWVTPEDYFALYQELLQERSDLKAVLRIPRLCWHLARLFFAKLRKAASA